MNSPPQILPPRWPLKFLRFFIKKKYLEEIEGDMEERFQDNLERYSIRKARRLYAWDVLKLFKPALIRKIAKNYQLSQVCMFSNYFKIATRSLLKKKIYSGINILGLSVGAACCLLIFQYVVFECSFDTFHKNASSVYRVNQTIIVAGSEPGKEANSGWAMGPAIAHEIPEIQRFVRLHPDEDVIVSNPDQPHKAFEEDWLYYADSTFLQMFSFSLVSGNPDQASLAPGTLMLSESLARKYFGDDDPIGHTLDVKGWISGSYQINGIFKDIPDNSHLRFDILLPMSDLLKKSRFKDPKTGWNWTNFVTYVQLHENIDLTAVEEKITDVFLKNRDQDFKASSTTGYLNLQPLLDIHLNDTISAPKAVMGSYQTVYFFAIIGLVTLLTAFVNYVNLTTARALDRAREVGVRKVIGAQRVQLIAQFLSESAVTIFLALVLAVAMAFVFSPVVQDWTGITFANTLWTEPYLWLTLLALFCISTLMAGLYPSLMLSSFKPAEVLKGTSGRFRVGIPIRQGLVVFQFTTSFVLLVGAFVVHLQLHYILNMNVGIGLEQVITVPSPRVLPGKSTRADAIETFTQQLHQLPGIQQTATSHELPGQGFNLNTDHARRVEAIPSSNVPASAVWIDDSFARLYGLKLLAGPGFKDISLEAADQEPFPIMANETAIKSLGFDSPMHALDQRIDLANGNLCYIVGVFKDFNWSSAHKQRENVFFFLGAGLSHISIKATTENLPQTISDIEKTYKQLFPGNPFQYAFADETFKAQYGNEQRFAKLFNLFVALAIFIAGLGLFGLTTFTVQQRKVEVGIRKVLGATLASVVLLLSRDLLKLVIAGFLIAVPIAWYVMSSWLEDFAYRIEVGMGVFLLAGAVTVLIALITLSFKSIKAALANPVDSLRNE